MNNLSIQFLKQALFEAQERFYGLNQSTFLFYFTFILSCSDFAFIERISDQSFSPSVAHAAKPTFSILFGKFDASSQNIPSLNKSNEIESSNVAIRVHLAFFRSARLQKLGLHIIQRNKVSKVSKSTFLGAFQAYRFEWYALDLGFTLQRLKLRCEGTVLENRACFKQWDYLPFFVGPFRAQFVALHLSLRTWELRFFSKSSQTFDGDCDQTRH